MAIFIFSENKQIKYYAMPAEKAVPAQPRVRTADTTITTVPKYNYEAKTSTFFTGKDTFIIFCAFLFLVGAVAFLISSRTSVTESTRTLQNIEAQITELNTQKSNLTQEVQELSRYDRMMEIAKENGLEMNEDNIRNVDK